MSPSDDEPYPLGELLSRIERLLPQTNRAEAETTVAEIRNALREVRGETKAEELVQGVIIAVFGRAAFRSESLGKEKQDNAADVSWYRAERLKIEKAVAFLAEHPLVARLDMRMIRIFSLEESKCVHQRLRRECERIREVLRFLRGVNGCEIVVLAGLQRLGLLPLPGGTYRTAFVGPSVGRLRQLGELGVSAEANPEDFCQPKDVPSEFPPIPPEHKKRRGRPSAANRHEVVEDMIELLHVQGGLPVERSCEFVSMLLRAFYGIEIDADPLRQSWYRARLASAEGG